MFQQTLTADGFSKSCLHPGGRTHCRIRFNSGSGTVSLMRASLDSGGESTSDYEAYAAATTVTETTAINIEPGACMLAFEVSGSSTPNITVELSNGLADGSIIERGVPS